MVEIIPYQDSWPSDFREIALRLRQGLVGLAFRIDHIGSTSVSGLAAKDVIDTQIRSPHLTKNSCPICSLCALAVGLLTEPLVALALVVNDLAQVSGVNSQPAFCFEIPK